MREVSRSPDGSRIVSTPKGTVQMTVVERDDAYIARMYERVEQMWDKYGPRSRSRWLDGGARSDPRARARERAAARRRLGATRGAPAALAPHSIVVLERHAIRRDQAL